MGIYLPNMEMPTEYPLWIVVSADGTVQYNYFNEWKTAEEKAVSVPPHGRLIDADSLLSQFKGNIWTAQTDYAEGLRDVANDIKQAPTIIEAEEGEDGCN